MGHRKFDTRNFLHIMVQFADSICFETVNTLTNINPVVCHPLINEMQ